MIPSLVVTNITHSYNRGAGFEIFRNNITTIWVTREHKRWYFDSNSRAYSFVSTGCNGNGTQYYEHIYGRHNIEIGFFICWYTGERDGDRALWRIRYKNAWYFPK